MPNFNNTSYTTKMTVKESAIANRLFNSYTAMYNFASDANDTAINGLTLTVAESVNKYENGEYYLVSGAGTNNVVFERVLTSNTLKTTSPLSSITNASGVTIQLNENEVNDGVYNRFLVDKNGVIVSGDVVQHGTVKSATTVDDIINVEINNKVIQVSHKTNSNINDGFVKFNTDGYGHIISTSAVTASDLPSHTHDYLSSITTDNAIDKTISDSVATLTHKTSTPQSLGLVKIQTDAFGHVIDSTDAVGTDLPSHIHSFNEITNKSLLISGLTDSETVKFSYDNRVKADVAIEDALSFTVTSTTINNLKKNLIKTNNDGLYAVSYCDLDLGRNMLIFANANGVSSLSLSNVGRNIPLSAATNSPIQLSLLNHQMTFDLAEKQDVTPNGNYNLMKFDKYGLLISGSSEPIPINSEFKVSDNLLARTFEITCDKDLIENVTEISDADFAKALNVDVKSYNFIDDLVDKKRYGVLANDLTTAGLTNLVNIDSNNNESVDIISFLCLKTEYYNRLVKKMQEQLNYMNFTIDFTYDNSYNFYTLRKITIVKFAFFNISEVSVTYNNNTTVINSSEQTFTKNGNTYANFQIDSNLIDGTPKALSIVYYYS